MLLLSDLFDTLAFGELSGIKLGSAGEIVEANYPKIVSHINLGLLELYKRFNIKRDELTIYQHADTTRYNLKSEHLGAVADMAADVYILEDEDNPFADDLIKVLEVYDEDEDQLPLNDKNDSTSVFTPSPDILKMTPASPVETVSVLYKASHPKIVITDNFDPDVYELEMPEFLQEALLFYVAARAFSGIKTGGVDTAKNPTYALLTQYETACHKIQMFNLEPEVNDTQTGFENNGWA